MKNLVTLKNQNGSYIKMEKVGNTYQLYVKIGASEENFEISLDKGIEAITAVNKELPTFYDLYEKKGAEK